MRISSYATFPELISSLCPALIHLNCHMFLVLFFSGLTPTLSLPSSTTCHQQVRALEAILLCIKVLFLHLHRPCGIFPNAAEGGEEGS